MNFSLSHFTSLANLLINAGIPVAGAIKAIVCLTISIWHHSVFKKVLFESLLFIVDILFVLWVIYQAYSFCFFQKISWHFCMVIFYNMLSNFHKHILCHYAALAYRLIGNIDQRYSSIGHCHNTKMGRIILASCRIKSILFYHYL